MNNINSRDSDNLCLSGYLPRPDRDSRMSGDYGRSVQDRQMRPSVRFDNFGSPNNDIQEQDHHAGRREAYNDIQGRGNPAGNFQEQDHHAGQREACIGAMHEHRMDSFPRNRVHYANNLQEQDGISVRDGRVPSVSSLRQDRHIDQCVARRLAELGIHDDYYEIDSESTKRKRGKRSGISRTVEDMVVNEIDWPHFYVYRGQERKPIQYAQITQSEFMYGFLAMLDNPRNTMDKEIMLALLKDLMLDASQYGWTHIRSYYSMLASGVEMARYSWSDTAQIAELRMQFAQRPMFGSQQRQPYNSRQPNPQGNVRICIPFQSDTCPHFGAHDGYNHACAFCFANTGMLFNHKERDCRRKLFKSKNGPQGET